MAESISTVPVLCGVCLVGNLRALLDQICMCVECGGVDVSGPPSVKCICSTQPWPSVGHIISVFLQNVAASMSACTVDDDVGHVNAFRSKFSIESLAQHPAPSHRLVNARHLESQKHSSPM